MVVEERPLDEVHVDLVLVLLGDGIPFFLGLGIAPVDLEGLFRVVEGTGVSHLACRVAAPPDRHQFAEVAASRSNGHRHLGVAKSITSLAADQRTGRHALGSPT
ncbi:hypothetical protein O7600_15530 [Micromonospora sp. WMMA1998]|uniref:hypothetical protein n=1 Tax=Micromonospora sp. WMMA1998 TaxID=3015167 RepID=UPI00248B58EB|nr:hypothetical protein [Micromonospora sp. WMMA1998]WBC12598.1 hypothetical protein O7600_15530 [Micromonospora sp. WMMA1998]